MKVGVLSPVWFPVPPDAYGGIEWIVSLLADGLVDDSRDEPFGLVMIESIACGTPVVATRYGAVSEVIEDGVSGVIVDRWRDISGALERVDAIDSRVQRQVVDERFSPARMVADYVSAYEATIARWEAPAAR